MKSVHYHIPAQKIVGAAASRQSPSVRTTTGAMFEMMVDLPKS